MADKPSGLAFAFPNANAIAFRPAERSSWTIKTPKSGAERIRIECEMSIQLMQGLKLDAPMWYSEKKTTAGKFTESDPAETTTLSFSLPRQLQWRSTEDKQSAAYVKETQEYNSWRASVLTRAIEWLDKQEPTTATAKPGSSAGAVVYTPRLVKKPQSQPTTE